MMVAVIVITLVMSAVVTLLLIQTGDAIHGLQITLHRIEKKLNEKK